MYIIYNIFGSVRFISVDLFHKTEPEPKILVFIYCKPNPNQTDKKPKFSVWPVWFGQFGRFQKNYAHP